MKELIDYVVQYKLQDEEEWKDVLQPGGFVCENLEFALLEKEAYQKKSNHDFRIIKRGYHKAFELVVD